ncbi:MAG: insulinase family protein, partial [Rhodobacteraceae bacterium]|nr:insulinase family protein [Paracoccaceae bacterium]
MVFSRFAAPVLICAGLLSDCASPQRSDPATTAAQSDASPDGTATTEQSTRLFDLPHLQQELDNGLRVIVVKAPFKDTVSVQIPLQTGSRNEVEPGKTGFAHFFEHMMFRGT